MNANSFDYFRCPALKISVYNDGKVKVTTKFDIEASDENVVDIIFVRRNTNPINSKNVGSCLDILTLKGSPVDSLYNALKSIWCPILLESTTWTDKLPSRVKQLLSDLESGLESASTSSGERRSTDIEDISNIADPIDEFNYWRDLKDDRRSPHCHLARIVDQEYNKLSQQGFQDIFSINIDEFNILLSLCFDCLNNAWVNAGSEDRQYPQKRMEHLFGLIGHKITQYFQKYCTDISVFLNESDLGINGLKLQNVYQLCARWTDVTKQLTKSYWNASTNRSLKYPWKGEGYQDPFMDGFTKRILQVATTLSTIQELTQLLTIGKTLLNSLLIS